MYDKEDNAYQEIVGSTKSDTSKEQYVIPGAKLMGWARTSLSDKYFWQRKSANPYVCWQ